MEPRGSAQQLVRIRQLTRSGQARRIRIAASLSQAEIAGEVGVSPSAVARWELGNRLPHGDLAIRYLGVLNSLVAELVS